MLNSVSGGDYSFCSPSLHYIFDNSVWVLCGIYEADNNLASEVLSVRAAYLVLKCCSDNCLAIFQRCFVGYIYLM